MRLAAIILLLASILLYPAELFAAEAVGVHLPAGNHVRLAEYFPVVVSLEEHDVSSDTEILISLGELTFQKRVFMSTGTSKRLLMWVMTLDQNPEVILEVRSIHRRRLYPEFSRSLTEKLSVLSREHHIAGILTNSSNTELLQMFRLNDVTTVELKPRLEFPFETFSTLDLVAFDGSLWNEMPESALKGLEAYLENGGKVYISNREEVPPLAPDGSHDKELWESSWGLGKLYVLNPAFYVSAGHPGFADLKEIVASATGITSRRTPLLGSLFETSDIFEAQPRYRQSRSVWAVYLAICCLILCAVGMCTLLRLWSRRLGYVLVLALSAALSAGFSFVAPCGEASYERITAILTASGKSNSPSDKNTAIRRTYIHLCGFSDVNAADFKLYAGGLILPSGTGWNGRRDTRLVLHNGDAGALSGLSLKRGASAVFELIGTYDLEGTFETRKRKGAFTAVNNTGIDLHDCLLVSSGTGRNIGTFRFGESIELALSESRPLKALIGARYETQTRKGRILASFIDKVLDNGLHFRNTYLIGWSLSEDPLPEGYAQASDLGTLWIVELRKEN